jgi:hypothetical protein
MLPTKLQFIWLSSLKKEDFLEINQSEKKIACGSLLTDLDKMSSLHREPYIDASYQVSVHLAKQFQRRRFLNIGQSETRVACGSHVC